MHRNHKNKLAYFSVLIVFTMIPQILVSQRVFANRSVLDFDRAQNIFWIRPQWLPELINAYEIGYPDTLIYKQCMEDVNVFGKPQTCRWRKCIAHIMYDRELPDWVLIPGRWKEANYLCTTQKVEMKNEIVRDTTAYIKDNVRKTLKDVKFHLVPLSQHPRICDVVSFKLQVSYHFRSLNGVKDIVPTAAIWTITPKKGLVQQMGQKVSGKQRRAKENISLRFFAQHEGKYLVEVSLGQGFKPEDLGWIESDDPPGLAVELANRLYGSSATYQFTVPPPTVKNVSIVPSSMRVLAGEWAILQDVVASFNEDCVRDLHFKEIEKQLTLSAIQGNIINKQYIAPEIESFKPVDIRIYSESHPNFIVKPCETISLKAEIARQSEIDVISATYKGITGKSEVEVVPLPIPKTDEFSWSSSGPSTIAADKGKRCQINVETEKDFTITVTELRSGLTASKNVKVEKPTVNSIEIIPPSGNVNIGASKIFKVYKSFDVSCFKPKPVKASWMPGNSFGSSYRFEAKKPEGRKTIFARYRNPEDGKIFKAKAEIFIPWPKLIIKPDKSEIKLDQSVNFKAYWMTGGEAWSAEDIEWSPFNSINARKCGKFTIKASHRKSGKTATKKVEVVADCISIRKKLAETRNPKGDPDHIQESIKWLKTRLKLLKEKNCNCKVPPDWEKRFETLRTFYGAWSWTATCKKVKGDGSVSFSGSFFIREKPVKGIQGSFGSAHPGNITNVTITKKRLIFQRIVKSDKRKQKWDGTWNGEFLEGKVTDTAHGKFGLSRECGFKAYPGIKKKTQQPQQTPIPHKPVTPPPPKWDPGTGVG